MSISKTLKNHEDRIKALEVKTAVILKSLEETIQILMNHVPPIIPPRDAYVGGPAT